MEKNQSLTLIVCSGVKTYRYCKVTKPVVKVVDFWAHANTDSIGNRFQVTYVWQNRKKEKLLGKKGQHFFSTRLKVWFEKCWKTYSKRQETCLSQTIISAKTRKLTNFSTSEKYFKCWNFLISEIKQFFRNVYPMLIISSVVENMA